MDLSLSAPSYFCQDCKIPCPTRQALHRHRQEAHLKIKFKCTKCLQLFRTYDKFRKHREDLHNWKTEAGQYVVKAEVVRMVQVPSSPPPPPKPFPEIKEPRSKPTKTPCCEPIKQETHLRPKRLHKPSLRKREMANEENIQAQMRKVKRITSRTKSSANTTRKNIGSKVNAKRAPIFPKSFKSTTSQQIERQSIKRDTKTGIMFHVPCDASPALPVVAPECKSELTQSPHSESKRSRGIPRGKVCLFCGKVLPGQYRLEQHMTTHTQERPYFCPHCDETWPTPKALYRHKQVAHLEIKYRCSECHWLGDSYEKFRKHRRNTHRCKGHGDLINGKCTIVGEMVKIQGGEVIPFQKEKKEEKEARSKEKKRYVPKKKSTQQYDCLFCGKMFKEAFQLEMHMNSHTGERPYECKRCDDANFPCRYSLYKHGKKCNVSLANQISQDEKKII